MNRLHVALLLLTCLPVFFPCGLLAETAVIDCPERNDFDACYLTPENPYECNWATLFRGLTVEILGRASNGRYLVRVPLPHGKVIAHQGWPAGNGPVGYVNPDFLVLGRGTGSATSDFGDRTDSPSNRTSSDGADSGSGGEDLPDLVAAASAERNASRSWNGFPDRPSECMTGSEFLAATNGVSSGERERAIMREILRGNVPSHLRRFVAIDLGSGATAHALPGVLAIGSDEDFVRIPMQPATAQRLCDALGASLPTKKLSDLIHRQAANKANPRPLPPGSQMMSNGYYGRANALVDRELAGRDLNRLTAGTKKDIVLSNRLASHPGRVCIYGWHHPSGSAIQPLSTVHGASYVDYSHGVRLISSTVEVDGQNMNIRDVLTSSSLSGLVSDEGPMQVTGY